MTTKSLHHHRSKLEHHYHWVTWLGGLLYIQVVLAVGMFFAVGMAIPNSGWGTGLLDTKLFIALFISIPATAVVYLLAVFMFLYSKSTVDGEGKRAIKITVAISLAVMAYCVWWVARSFI